jgi:DNA-binding transcriptional LysR family regulator
MIACVRAGLGIAVASAWLCRTDLASDAVVQILAEHTLAPVEVHAVFPGGANPPSKVRALVDHMAAALRKPGQDDVVPPLAARASA